MTKYSVKNKSNEDAAFIQTKPEERFEPKGCCLSRHTWNCCFVVGLAGSLFVILGIIVMFAGESLLAKKILKTMALSPGSDRMESWLRPPVQPYLTAYAFHVTNPDEVLNGGKPILEERGPFVYKSRTLKDTDDNMEWGADDGLLTYRPRKLYTYMPGMSNNRNPDTEYITVPNIPLWTGLNSGRKNIGIALGFIKNHGRATPFVNVSFSGLLWGYEDELPCLKFDLPKGCAAEEDNPFSNDDSFPGGGGGSDSDDGLSQLEEKSYYDQLAKPKAEFVNCTCNWGLFRDRNITMRKPIQFYTGVSDLSMKGLIKKYDGKSMLGWWKKGSKCDAVGGQDSSTIPPSITKDTQLEMFIALMCRKLPMVFEKEVVHAGIRSLRFVPTVNAFGSVDDPDPTIANPDNACYCMKNENFKCFKSGVLNMEPCKRDVKAPLALSMPHFYQADPSFRERVGGMVPDKEKHEFYVDVVPEFGFPLAIRPRFQLNIVLQPVPQWGLISRVQADLVLPFLWAQDGFDEPSPKMADDIKFGLDAPNKISLMGAGFCVVLGSMLLLSALVFFVWRRRRLLAQEVKIVEESICLTPCQ